MRVHLLFSIWEHNLNSNDLLYTLNKSEGSMIIYFTFKT